MHILLVYCILYVIIIHLTADVLNPIFAATQPSGGSATHVCGVIDDQWEKHHSRQFPNRHYARTAAANLDVGEPLTVRLIYSLPNDRLYRDDVVQRIKDQILRIQVIYAESMKAHGYTMTFKIESDEEGEPRWYIVWLGKSPSFTMLMIQAGLYALKSNKYLM